MFIGLLPNDDVRDAIAEHQRRWYWNAGSLPTRPERLHLTLHFLGEINATREHALRSALAGEDVAPFELALRTPECWAGGITVLRPDDNAMLQDLHARLAARLSRVGIAPMRGSFAPHVTLARGARRGERGTARGHAPDGLDHHGLRSCMVTPRPAGALRSSGLVRNRLKSGRYRHLAYVKLALGSGETFG